MSGEYADVALPPPLARELTYRIPSDLGDSVQPGALVLVPVGRRRLSGVVVRRTGAHPEDVGPADIRELEDVLDPAAVPPELMELCMWMADYYFSSAGSACLATLPPGLHLASQRLVSLAAQDPGTVPGHEEDEKLLALLKDEGPQRVASLRRRFGRRKLESMLRRLRRTDRVRVTPVLPVRRTRARTVQHVRLRPDVRVEEEADRRQRRAPRQAGCLRHLKMSGAALPSAQLAAAGFPSGVVAALERDGLVERFPAEVLRDPLAHIGQAEVPHLVPTPQQQEAIARLGQAVRQRRFHPALLHGVTGSGKTLVYMELAARALEQDRGVIVLVPEIALAWQMVRRFKARFGDSVAVLHSQLSDGERYDTWRRLRRGEQRLVIGARSTILAPVRDPGLIIVDEEHDAAYKQENVDSPQSLIYHARDVALVRAQRACAVVVLGSATPSLESYVHARSGKYRLYSLPHRVDDRPLPRVHVVDMRQEPRQGRHLAIFSRLLRRKIRARLEQGQRVVLLQNRRGFAPFIVCAACGEAVRCGLCRVSMTYHRHREGDRAEIRCHYCDRREPVPQVCPSCGAADLRFQGVGTQRVEEALVEQFPGVRVIRMDVDTTSSKGAHDDLVERFRHGEADILLGTQMVAKGLDFPEVTLVGVISADTGMHMPDFRAAERSFQLLTQVAGRSGRGTVPGEVVVQTLLPDSSVLQAAAAQDFAAFAEAELSERREAGYPPFGRLALLLWRGEDETKVQRTAQRGTQDLMVPAGRAVSVLGPAPAPLAQLRGLYRYQSLLCATSSSRLHQVLHRSLEHVRAHCPRAVELTVNIDPQTMM